MLLRCITTTTGLNPPAIYLLPDVCRGRDFLPGSTAASLARTPPIAPASAVIGEHIPTSVRGFPAPAVTAASGSCA